MDRSSKGLYWWSKTWIPVQPMIVTPAVFVSKADVRGWPLIGWLTKLSGTVFIEHERRSHVGEVNREIESALADDLLVVIFPEGTSSDGKTVLPFRSSLLEPVLRVAFSNLITTAVTTANKTITVTSTVGLEPGQPVTGAGVPVSTVISAINTDGTTFTTYVYPAHCFRVAVF